MLDGSGTTEKPALLNAAIAGAVKPL